ncbi:hypothetical protein [Paramagnetospirillum marisnigri]|uniref:hypothetical protein n=1 Tax=Paramagnetospirillum marisnigri TaxID=1285242 RepID=UPI000A471839|nr:hypothetical protein [Paramagnetospirillum marisnigri]
MDTAKICGIPMPFEVIANAVNGEVYMTVALAGQRHSFVLSAEVALSVSTVVGKAGLQASGQANG